MSLLFASATDTGRLRANNEDCVLIDAALGLAVLADGMGGYNAGEVASYLCCETIHHSLRALLGAAHPVDALAALVRAIEEANHRIYSEAQRHAAYEGMSTTVVAVLVKDKRLIVGHVGDSRLYCWRQGRLSRLTRDHSVVQAHVDAGLLSPHEARLSGSRNLLTRAVGIAPWVEADVAEHTAEPDDTYLLCSDGLTDMLTEAEIAQIVGRQDPLAQRAYALVAAANAAGGRDNITVALIDCKNAAAVSDPGT